MRQLLTTIGALGFAITAFSQSSLDTQPRQQYQPETPTNQERYGIDYQLKDYPFIDGDSTILNLIDLSYLEEFRTEDQDVEIIDPYTGLTVILYFEKKTHSTLFTNDKK